MTAGPWLRLTALAAVAGVVLVVATGEWALAHDVASHATLALLAAVALAARYAHPERPSLFAAAVGALAAFAVAGLSALAGAPGGLHLTLGAVSLAAATVSAVTSFRRAEPVASPSRGLLFGSVRGAWRDYVTLTKPRIMTLLLLTAAGGLFLGAGGVPSVGLLAATLGGLALACGGASALNHVLDRDVDRLMGKRTERRPVAAGRVPPPRALEFGVALSAFSFVVLVSLVNVVAALLAVFGNLFYVLVYTRWLKRSTPQNIVIGGAAGAIPPVVGWAAATGSLTLPAALLFLIVFFWTPPHFWALALLIRRDYEAARIPMLPVVKGERETARAILRYSLVLVAITLLPVAARTVGALYLVSALALGAAFLALSVALLRATTPARARRLFSFSLAYLALLFVALALDPILLA
ncbi:MAG: heme o synthase [Actinomycetota bacterium]|nr:heme o synthase [Actinomycetota bacterium]